MFNVVSMMYMIISLVQVYLRAHVEQFKYGVFDSLQWKQFFLEHFKKEVSRHDTRHRLTSTDCDCKLQQRHCTYSSMP